MNRLFTNGIGDKLLDHADRLKLDVWKCEDGVVVNFELHGNTGDLDHEDGSLAEPADLRFVNDLIERFRKGGAK